MDDRLTEAQERAVRNIAEDEAVKVFHERMSDLGFGTQGEPRQATLQNNWFLNKLREAWDSIEEVKDRTWVRATRELWNKPEQEEIRASLLKEHERSKKWEANRGAIFTAIIGAIVTAALVGLFGHISQIAKVLIP